MSTPLLKHIMSSTTCERRHDPGFNYILTYLGLFKIRQTETIVITCASVRDPTCLPQHTAAVREHCKISASRENGPPSSLGGPVDSGRLVPHWTGRTSYYPPTLVVVGMYVTSQLEEVPRRLRKREREGERDRESSRWGLAAGKARQGKQGMEHLHEANCLMFGYKVRGSAPGRVGLDRFIFWVDEWMNGYVDIMTRSGGEGIHTAEAVLYL